MTIKMKKTTRWFVLGLCVLASCDSGTEKGPRLMVGVASATINPSLGSFIAGDKQNRTFTGILDSLYAKAMVATFGDQTVSLVTIDCIGLMYNDALKIRERAAELVDIPEERIVISSTHTHSGPDVVGIWGSDYAHSGVDSAYMERLIHTAANQIQAAYRNQVPVDAFVSETSFGDPWVENICGEEIDRSVSILQFRDERNKVITTLSNFASHPTILDAEFSVISADFVGGYYKHMKQTTGAEGLFLQGAIGGWIQPEGMPKTIESANQFGEDLAKEVLNSVSEAKQMMVVEIAFNRKLIKFPVENETWKQLSSLGTINRSFGDSVSTEISWFEIGEAQFVTHPGETAPSLGLASKQMMGAGPKFVLGLGNDALGYILKTTFFEHDSIPHAPYLTSMSLGPKTGPLLMEALRNIIPEDDR